MTYPIAGIALSFEVAGAHSPAVADRAWARPDPRTRRAGASAEDPSEQVFCSAAAARSLRSGRGKNLAATVLQGAGAAHRSHATSREIAPHEGEIGRSSAIGTRRRGERNKARSPKDAPNVGCRAAARADIRCGNDVAMGCASRRRSWGSGTDGRQGTAARSASGDHRSIFDKLQVARAANGRTLTAHR